MDKQKKVALVTPVFNRRDLTLQCLRSLARIDRDGLALRIFVVDDGSSDGTSEAIREQFPEVILVQGTGDLWYTEGSNRGIRAAMEWEPEYVLLFNDDTVFDSKFLQNMVGTADKHERTVVGALLLNWDNPHRVYQVSPVWNMWQGGWRHWLNQTVWSVPDRPWEVDIIVGNCVLFPAQAIRECGVMNSDLFPHFGDAEYTPRLKSHGWKLLVEPQARAFCQPHDPPPSLRKMGLAKGFRAFFLDSINANGLRRRLYGSMFSGHGKLNGFAACLVFYLRYFIGLNAEGEWARRQEEMPLKDVLADRVVE